MLLNFTSNLKTVNRTEIRGKSALIISVCVLITGVFNIADAQSKIDRHALVTRHNVKVTRFDSLASLSVGNGDFAFTVGATGLQTFPNFYEPGIPLGTQSQWGWHSFPNPEHYTISDATEKFQSCNGREVPYDVQPHGGRGAKAAHWLRTNPHRLHLGLVGLVLKKKNGEEVQISDITNIRQELNLWTGKIDSKYSIEGEPVHVELYGHQNRDEISVRIHSPLIKENRLKITFRFPYGNDCHVCPGYDWNHPDKHETRIISANDHEAMVQHNLDTTTYYVDVDWKGKSTFKNTEVHTYQLVPGGDADSLSFSVLFKSERPKHRADNFLETQQNNRKLWKKYWTDGAAVDFAGSTDPRANELERRVVLSQYLTKIQTSGPLPPQETGLTMNSWYGKFHLEMHWWHGVHFALWNRADLLEKSMAWYKKVLPKARETARWQGYDGARWQKMTGPNGRKSPSNVGEFLIWQEPHVIYFSELFYQQHPNRETLEKYKNLVFQTADFMASYVTFDKNDGFFHLCAPLIPAQEIFHAKTTKDPPFELAYLHYGLKVAQKWRKRLGLKPNKKWQEVLDKLAPLPVKNGLYLPDAHTPDAYQGEQYRRDHPVVTGAFGMLPGSSMIDTTIMKRTFNNIMNDWQWKTTWGWDFPMLAMAATRLGMPEKAVDALMMNVQKNTYLKNGHNYQNSRLRLYLPGNGGLLTAVAMMAAGWQDGPDRNTPGFPDNGKWKVRWEGLQKMP